MSSLIIKHYLTVLERWKVCFLFPVVLSSRLLLSLHHLPLPEPSTDGPLFNQKRLLGVTADGTMWIHHLFELAKMLLSQRRHVESCQSFSPEQKEAWDRYSLTNISAFCLRAITWRLVQCCKKVFAFPDFFFSFFFLFLFCILVTLKCFRSLNKFKY